jgi:hypothetical protein
LILGSIALIAALAPAPQAPADHLKELAAEKARIAKQVADFYEDIRLAPDGGRPPAPLPGQDAVETWTRLAVDARLDASASKQERIAILTEDLERTKAIEARLKDMADAEAVARVAALNRLVRIDAMKARYFRLDAEYRLEKEKAGR